MDMKPLKRCHLELSVFMIVALASTALFWLTNLDHWTATWFFHPEQVEDVWPKRHWWLWDALYDYALPFTVACGVLALLIFLASHRVGSIRGYRHKALYILLVIALGPGVFVNLVAKDHWGRPRPLHTKEFGGQYDYVPPLKIGHTPDKSFVCGHCSAGYAFFALYFLAQNYKALYLVLTLALAWIMGFSRMTSGSHYLSDILWSGYLVFLVAFALYYGWYRRYAPIAGTE